MTLQELIEKARGIESSTDANIGGAIVQVTNRLSIDDCEELFIEYAAQDEKKLKRFAKKVLRARSDKYFNVSSLQIMVDGLLNILIRES